MGWVYQGGARKARGGPHRFADRTDLPDRNERRGMKILLRLPPGNGSRIFFSFFQFIACGRKKTWLTRNVPIVSAHFRPASCPQLEAFRSDRRFTVGAVPESLRSHAL